MIVVDPGHEYLLDSLDGDAVQRLVFVKREGTKYPGNIGSHPGTTLQEVLRALVERCVYVNRQIPCDETGEVIDLLTRSLVLLEERAARRHGRALMATAGEIVAGAGKCAKCGHVGCAGGCKPHAEGDR
jgi:hypothetical protein